MGNVHSPGKGPDTYRGPSVTAHRCASLKAHKSPSIQEAGGLMLAGEARMAQATGSSPALQTYLHPWGPWAWGGGGDRWF